MRWSRALIEPLRETVAREFYAQLFAIAIEPSLEQMFDGKRADAA